MSGVEFIVGTSLGVAGLLLGFKGAVDGFNLISDIFADDTGVEFSGLVYHVQVAIFQKWGERMRIEDADVGLLSKESDITKRLIAMIITEIQVTQEMVAKEYLKKYELGPIPPPPPNCTALHTKSLWVEHVRKQRTAQRQRHRLKWSTGGKQRLEELLNRLTTLNEALQKLVRHEIDKTNLVSSIVTGLKDASSLVPVARRPGTSDLTDLLLLSAQVKILVQEDTTTAANQVQMIQESELDIVDTMDGLSTGDYNVIDELPLPVMVEWKSVPGGTANTEDIVTRIKALGALLSRSNIPEFCHLECLGIFADEAHARATKGRQQRLGIVYRMAEGLSVPIESESLSSRLRRAKRDPRPPLGDRFKLASRLATAVSLLHATNWIHKSLRSDNILLSSADITSPYLCGFQYSRPAHDTSRETRPTNSAELNMYYHHDTANGWTKVKEIYSLGVVLMEIAFWRPVFEEKYRAMSMKEVSEALIDEMEGKFGQDLKGIVGKVFVDVILNCLKGNFGVTSGDTMTEAKILQKQFYHKVVQPLAMCNA